MLGKKILNIVGLLCLSQFHSVLAEVNDPLPACSVTNLSETCKTDTVSGGSIVYSSTTYCTYGNKIYSFDGDNCTGYINVEGVYAFDNTANTALEMGTGTPTPANIVLYDCNSSGNCVRTFGYVKFTSNYVAKYNADPTTVTTAECNVGIGSSGKVNANGDLCLLGDSVSPISVALNAVGDYYLVMDKDGVFSADNEAYYGVKRTANSFTAYTAFEEGEGKEYCVDTETGQIYNASGKSRKDAFCTDPDANDAANDTWCDEFFNCAAETGLCTPAVAGTSKRVENECTVGTSITDDKCKGANGYFMVKGGNVATLAEGKAGTDVSLYKCVGAGECQGPINVSQAIGLVPNADTATNESAPYISYIETVVKAYDVADLTEMTDCATGTGSGKLMAGGLLCLKGTGNGINLSATDDGIYIIENTAGSNLFNVGDGINIAIEIKDHVATPVTYADEIKYYGLLSTSQQALTAKTTGTANAATVTLYSCNSEECTAKSASDVLSGWYLNAAAADVTNSSAGAYIKCSGEASKTCDVVDIAAGANNGSSNLCTAAEAGSVVYFDTYVYTLCQADGVGVTLSTTSSSCFVDASSNNKILKTPITASGTYYHLMEITGKTAVVPKQGTGNARYTKYKYAVKSTLLIGDKTQICSGSAFQSTAAEYILDKNGIEETDFYIINEA